MRHNYIELPEFDDGMSFGAFLRKKRRLMGYNQTDLGKIIGVHQHTISQWELGNFSPDIEVAREIIKRLGGELRIVNKGGAE